MRKLAALSTLVALALTQTGFTCGPGIDPPGVRCEAGAAPSAPVVQIGAEVDGVFTEAMTDQLFPLEYGSQGGQHTFVALRFHSGDDDAWAHQITVTDAMGQEIGDRYIQESACAGRWTVLSNVQVFVYDPGASQVDLHVRSGPVDPDNGILQEVATGEAQLRVR
jgi:hypothetical protein